MMISIIVPTYNRVKDLSRLFDALVHQEDIHKNETEIIVVDNNSTDSTSEFITNASRDMPLPLVYLFEKKQGKTYALNTGIKCAKGEIIIFLDDDVIPEKKWFVSIADTFKNDHRVNMACGKILPLDMPSNLPSWCEWRRFRAVFGVTRYGEESRFLNECYSLPSGMNIAIRREALNSVGAFNNKFCGRGEDTEFCFRAQQQSLRIYYIAAAILYHKIQLEKLTKEYFAEYFYTSGLARSQFQRRFQFCPSVFNIPIWLSKEILYAGYVFLRELFLRGPNRAFSAYLELFYLAGCFRGRMKVRGEFFP